MACANSSFPIVDLQMMVSQVTAHEVFLRLKQEIWGHMLVVEIVTKVDLSVFGAAFKLSFMLMKL